MREGAAILLTDVLAAAGAPVIEREERLQAFDRLQLPAHATLSRASTIRVGEALAASAVVSGTMLMDGDQLTVRARVVRLDSGRLLPEVVATGSLDRSLQRVRTPRAADPQHARAAGAHQRSVRALAAGLRVVREGARGRNAIHRARVSRAGVESGAAVRSRAPGTMGSPFGSRRASARARPGLGHRRRGARCFAKAGFAARSR